MSKLKYPEGLHSHILGLHKKVLILHFADVTAKLAIPLLLATRFLELLTIYYFSADQGGISKEVTDLISNIRGYQPLAMVGTIVWVFVLFRYQKLNTDFKQKVDLATEILTFLDSNEQREQKMDALHSRVQNGEPLTIALLHQAIVEGGSPSPVYTAAEREWHEQLERCESRSTFLLFVISAVAVVHISSLLPIGKMLWKAM